MLWMFERVGPDRMHEHYCLSEDNGVEVCSRCMCKDSGRRCKCQRFGWVVGDGGRSEGSSGGTVGWLAVGRDLIRYHQSELICRPV